ncbi:M81 family metallopeptidase [Flavobacteriaceae bacterium]|jgi:microcystin degradation protein MlrC|nr:M81 family metallopeptidase [Flavobacteriaceae bacterium]
MKKYFLVIALLFILGCSYNNKKPRIAIAGLAIESSTFSPAKTIEPDFKARLDEDVFSYYPFLQKDSLYRLKANWIPTLRGHALPGGIVTKEAYNSLVNKTLEKLKNNLPYDGLFFDIHGAMSVEGIDDPEGDFIKKIRELVGYDTLISTSMDPHGNVSYELAMETDLITCYRMSPHEDAIESKRRAVTNLIERLESGKGKPLYKSRIKVPILLPGEKTSTRIEPGKSLYEKIDPETKKEGIIDAAIWMGYPWADEPRNHGVVVVYGDNKEEVKNSSEFLAKSFWDVKDKFEFVAPVGTLEKSLELALNSNTKPFIISDMGDNPTAGGAGDVTWTLKRLLERDEFKDENGPSLIYASIPGPKLIENAKNLKVGDYVEGFVGAEVDDRFSPPILLRGTIKSKKIGDINAKTELVVQSGSINVIVTEKRKPYHYIKDFTDLNLDPKSIDILMVKIGYLVPQLYDINKGWIMALTPGGVDQDLFRLDYKRIERPMFPVDEFESEPDLSAVFVPLSESN